MKKKKIVEKFFLSRGTKKNFSLRVNDSSFSRHNG